MLETISVVTSPKQSVVLPAEFDEDECEEWLLPITPIEALPTGLINDEL